MTQHTPSPWVTSKGAYGALHVGPATLAHPGRDRMAYTTQHGRDLLAQRAADAALIAAAPDLLDLCERLLGFAITYGDISAIAAREGLFVSARETIAKAKGGEA
jgi:hypothetical protein